MPTLNVIARHACRTSSGYKLLYLVYTISNMNASIYMYIYDGCIVTVYRAQHTLTCIHCYQQLHAQETVVLNLNFSPHHSRATVDVYIFINDNKDLTEECFLVKTIYS